MKLEHRILSIIAKLIHEFIVIGRAFPPTIYYTSAILILLCGKIYKRAQSRDNINSGNAFLSSSFAGPFVVAIISICYYFTIMQNEKMHQLMLERERRVLEYYDDPSHAHTLSKARNIPKNGLHYIDGKWKTIQSDNHGPNKESYIVRFRGVNLPAKTPSTPSQLKNTKHSHQFYESKRDVSFVNRPFSLEDAPEHFRRISHDWGFNLIRLSVTWEAVMHEGPGIIDQAYLSYLRDLVSLAEDYGLYVLIDPHQDVWSRFTGGDGAPWWTLDAAGFNTDSPALHGTGSAVLHQFWNTTTVASAGGLPIPKMMWTTNYWKHATATMFTLFFAGDVYAPGIVAGVLSSETRDGPSIQQFLQRHYLEYIDSVATAVKDCPNIIGFGTMNEPSLGFVGVTDLNEVHAPTLHGHVLSGFEGMLLAAGESLSVPFYPSHFLYHSHVTLNAKGQSAYKSPEHDVWRRVGVYDIDKATNKPILLRPDHFALKEDQDFALTFLVPFWHSVQKVIHRHNPNFATFAEPHFDPADPHPSAPVVFQSSPSLDSGKFVWAPHWYDAVTLFLGYYSHWFSFDFEWGIPMVTPYAIDWAFRKNLRKLKRGKRNEVSTKMYTIVGETGVPFSGSSSDFIVSLDRTLRAMEANDLDYIIWCYETSNDDNNGDLWNGENLSLTSMGYGRGLASAVRPHVHIHSEGIEVVWQHFGPRNGSYELIVRDNVDCKTCSASVIIFVPSGHFLEPTFSVGEMKYDKSSQSLKWMINGRAKGASHKLKISPEPRTDKR